MKNKVCIIGSGNWGSAIALSVGVNAAAHPELFERQVHSPCCLRCGCLPLQADAFLTRQIVQVSMYCYEEMIEGRKLTEIINTTHENVKYATAVRAVLRLSSRSAGTFQGAFSPKTWLQSQTSARPLVVSSSATVLFRTRC